MSDKNQTGVYQAAGVFAAVAGMREQTTLNKDIVNYATATGVTRDEMDSLKDSLDVNNLNSITTFAKEPSEILGETSDAIIQEVQSAGSFLEPFSEFKEAVANFDFDTLSEMAEDFQDSITRKLKLATYIAPVRWVLNQFSGDDPEIEDIRNEIDKSLLQLGSVMASLEEASEAIPGIVSRLDELRSAFTQSYSEYGLYIGAALERLRELEEVEIPKLQEEAAAGSLLKQEELQSTYMAMTILNKKITNMDNFHKQSLLNLARIRDLKKALAMSKLNIDEKLTVSEGEWKGILATNAVAVEVAEITGTVADADAFSRKIREQGVKVAGMIDERVMDAFEAGSVDAKRMVELLKDKAQKLNEEAAYLADFNLRQKAAREELDKAGRELLEAASQLHVPLSNDEIEEVKATAAADVKLLTQEDSGDINLEEPKASNKNDPKLNGPS
jgi:hypothetical protein